MNRMLVFATKKAFSSIENNGSYFFALLNPDLRIIYSNSNELIFYDKNTINTINLTKERKKTTYTIDDFDRLSICTPIQKSNGEIIGYIIIFQQSKISNILILLVELLSVLIYEKYKIYSAISIIKTMPYQKNLDMDLLTDKELLVVKLISEGKTDFYISEKLNISKSTVRAHINNIFRKLEISNRMHLMIYYYNYVVQNTVKMF